MIIRNISFDLPIHNIVYEDVLLECAEKGLSGEVLRFWESPVHFIVLGRICKYEQDLIESNIKADNIPVLRRSSGGGTIIQGPGCLNYSLILNKSRDKDLNDINKSYFYVLSRVINSLLECGIHARYFPVSDIALIENQKKFSGNAQCRRRDYFLHHGTILYGMDLALIGRYLKMPIAVPEYRCGRDHGRFVTNVPLIKNKFCEELAKNFEAIKEDNFVLPYENDMLYDKSLKRKLTNCGLWE